MISNCRRTLPLPEPGTETFFLWGPRQSGKTTLLRERYPEAVAATDGGQDEAYVSSTCQLKSNPEAFELLFQKNPYIDCEVKDIDLR